MELQEIIEDMQTDLDVAKKDMVLAKEVLEMGIEMNLDVSAHRKDIRDLQKDIDLYQRTIDKRKKAVVEE